MGKKLGDLRHSQIIMGYGPGALADYRSGEASISALMLGLDDWDKSKTRPVPEPALQKLLGGRDLRAPPVSAQERRADGNPSETPSLPARRFPDWQECPECHRLRPSAEWAKRGPSGEENLVCGSCTKSAGKPVPVGPARFFLSCRNGHLSDFPWAEWVDHRDGCDPYERVLRLEDKGAGLRGLYLNCSCGAGRSMNDALKAGFAAKACSGARPWLKDAPPESCDAPAEGVQRGASNAYFAVTVSALSIPPWSGEAIERIAEAGYGDDFQEALGEHAKTGDEEELQEELARIAKRLAKEFDEGSAEGRARWLERLRLLAVDHRRLPSSLEGGGELALRREEWRQFRMTGERPRHRHFELRDEIVPASLAPFIDAIVRAPRLREVSALRGFTRLHPPDSAAAGSIGKIAQRARWTPAVERLGEGVFVALSEDRVAAWEKGEAVQRRMARLEQARKGRKGAEQERPFRIGARFLLVHSLAHALMTRLALECGYGAAALRERLYVDDPASGEPMAGFLIYTSATGSEGSLGGLEREGRSARMENLIHGAISDIRWCSSDPLCLEGRSAPEDEGNLAACHSCLFAPETSCETFNRFLDRAMLIGDPIEGLEGFWRHDGS